MIFVKKKKVKEKYFIIVFNKQISDRRIGQHLRMLARNLHIGQIRWLVHGENPDLRCWYSVYVDPIYTLYVDGVHIQCVQYVDPIYSCKW